MNIDPEILALLQLRAYYQARVDLLNKLTSISHIVSDTITRKEGLERGKLNEKFPTDTAMGAAEDMGLTDLIKNPISLAIKKE